MVESQLTLEARAIPSVFTGGVGVKSKSVFSPSGAIDNGCLQSRSKDTVVAVGPVILGSLKRSDLCPIRFIDTSPFGQNVNGGVK